MDSVSSDGCTIGFKGSLFTSVAMDPLLKNEDC